MYVAESETARLRNGFIVPPYNTDLNPHSLKASFGEEVNESYSAADLVSWRILTNIQSLQR